MVVVFAGALPSTTAGPVGGWVAVAAGYKAAYRAVVVMGRGMGPVVGRFVVRRAVVVAEAAMAVPGWAPRSAVHCSWVGRLAAAVMTGWLAGPVVARSVVGQLVVVDGAVVVAPR